MDFSSLPDRELLEKLNTAVLTEAFVESQEWGLIQAACKRLVRKAQEELLDVDPTKDSGRIQELQILIKVLRNLLPGIVNAMRQDGKIAFIEAKERKLDDVADA